ncbi:MAG: 4Fe-4S double cluster binding domain-containing protein, partial [Phycisphaerales bacterium]
PDGLPAGSVLPAPCGLCTRCIDACPTEAITPWSVDASRCVSALTIEERAEVAGAFAGRTLDWIFGCDTCQEVCPHAQPTVRARRAPAHEAYRPHRTSVPLLEALGWNDADVEAARLNGVLRRATAAMWRRTAALAAGAALSDPHLPRAERTSLVRALVERASDAQELPWVRDASAAPIAAEA